MASGEQQHGQQPELHRAQAQGRQRGPILLAVWTSAPAGNNAAILDGAPSSNPVYCAWFPSGNVDTPSNLTASSGTIMGDDSNCVKVSAALAVATIYATGIVPFYFDSAEAVIFCWQNPSNNVLRMRRRQFAGRRHPTTPTAPPLECRRSRFAASNMTWANTKPQPTRPRHASAPTTGPRIEPTFKPGTPLAFWASSAVSSTDILTDTGRTKRGSCPCSCSAKPRVRGSYSKCARCHRAGHSWPADCLQHDGPGGAGSLGQHRHGRRQRPLVAHQLQAVISGTEFCIEDPVFVAHASRGLRPGVASASELAEIEAQCEKEEAICVCVRGRHAGSSTYDQGRKGLKLFVWLAIAFRHGAYERQDAALLAIARDLGAQTIAFVARRRGWARRLGPEWHRRGKDEFMRRVT